MSGTATLLSKYGSAAYIRFYGVTTSFRRLEHGAVSVFIWPHLNSINQLMMVDFGT